MRTRIEKLVTDYGKQVEKYNKELDGLYEDEYEFHKLEGHIECLDSVIIALRELL